MGGFERKSLVDQLIDLLKEKEANGQKIKVTFGLTLENRKKILDIIGETADWEAIGNAIGWHGETAKEWFTRDVLALEERVERALVLARESVEKAKTARQDATAAQISGENG